jgi:hypothetical protein
MSHDETSGPVTRKERRAARYGKRQAAPRYVFSAAAHVRTDWTFAEVSEFLERRARGYNGPLRQVLCTAAAQLTRAAPIVQAHDKGEVAPVVSKRNQQPGRLSGSEREALKQFVILAQATDFSQANQEEVLAAGRAMLAKVRKRALGGQAEEDDS